MTAAILVLLFAHESSVSSSHLDFRGREIDATFTFSLEDLAGLARLDLNRDGTVDASEWKLVLPGIFAYVGEHFRIENGGEACRSEGDSALVPPALRVTDGRALVTLGMRYISARPVEGLTLRVDLFNEPGGNPRHVGGLP